MSKPVWWLKDENGNNEIIAHGYVLKRNFVTGGRYYCNGTKLKNYPFTSYSDIYIGC